MPYEYSLYFTCRTGGILKAVKDIEDSINDTMHGFGFDEKMIIRGASPIVTKITSPVMLPTDKLREFGDLAACEYNKTLKPKGFDLGMEYDRYEVDWRE